jgi:hypothetical protein
MTDVSQFKQSDSQTVRSDFAYVDFDVAATVVNNVAMAGVMLDASGGLVDFATSALQTTANGLLTTIDGDTGTIATHAATLAGAVSGTEMQVDIVSGSVTVTGVSTLAEQQGQTTLLGTIDTDTGAIATSAASIDTKTPSLGQALAAASVPVVLTAAQITTLTPPAAITGFATESTLSSLNGKVTAVNTGAVVVSSSALPTGAATAANQQTDALTDTQLRATAVPVSGTFWQATQPVSGTIDLGATDNAVLDAIAASVASVDGKTTAINTGAVVVSSSALPSGASTAAKQPALGTAGTASSDVLTVQGIASMTALKVDGSAVTQPVSGTFWQATQPISAASLPSHDVTNAGTFAVQVSSALPAGTNAIGKLSANSGVDIGDVDVTSLPAITGTVTANAGTNLNTSALALESGGNLAAIATSAALIDDAIYANNTTAPSKFVGIGAWDGGNDTNNIMALIMDPFTLGLQVQIVGSSNSISVSGTVATDDAGAASSPMFLTGGRASAAAPSNVSADDDAVVQWHLRNGSQVCNLAVGGTLVTGSAGLPVAQQGTWNVGTVTTVTTCSTVTTLANGQTAHDSAVTGSPLRIGAKAETALSGITLVADGDATDLHAGIDGVQIVRNHCNLEDIVAGNASNTDGASTEVIAAAGSGIKQYLTSVSLANTSASTVYVELKSATTVRYRFILPAGGGVVHAFDPPLPPNAANEAWNYDPSAAATTTYCSLVGFKSKV